MRRATDDRLPVVNGESEAPSGSRATPDEEASRPAAVGDLLVCRPIGMTGLLAGPWRRYSYPQWSRSYRDCGNPAARKGFFRRRSQVRYYPFIRAAEPSRYVRHSGSQYTNSQDCSTAVGCFTELMRFTPVLRNLRFLICERERALGNALLSPRFRLSVGTLVCPGKGGILSLYQDGPRNEN